MLISEKLRKAALGQVHAVPAVGREPRVEQDDLYISLLAVSQYQYTHAFILDPHMHDIFISS